MSIGTWTSQTWWKNRRTAGSSRMISNGTWTRTPAAPNSDANSAIAWERSHPPKEVDQKRFDYAAEDAALTSRGT